MTTSKKRAEPTVGQILDSARRANPDQYVAKIIEHTSQCLTAAGELGLGLRPQEHEAVLRVLRRHTNELTDLLVERKGRPSKLHDHIQIAIEVARREPAMGLEKAIDYVQRRSSLTEIRKGKRMKRATVAEYYKKHRETADGMVKFERERHEK